MSATQFKAISVDLNRGFTPKKINFIVAKEIM